MTIFASRSFRLFFVGQTLSYIGDGLRTIAIPLLVYHLTGSASALGLTYALEFLPFALFGLIGGSLADRLDRGRLMIGCDAVRFIVIATFAFAYWRGALSLPTIYIGISIISIAASVFIGAQASTIPYLLGKERATRGIAALFATEQATLLITPPLGGALFALVGPLPALIANAATYLSSQIAIAVGKNYGPTEPSGPPSWRQIGTDIGLGFRVLFADPAMRNLTMLGGAFNFFALMTGAVFIPFLKRDFGATDYVVGIALGCGAIGAVLGSVSAGRISKRIPLGRILTVAYTVDGLVFLPIVFTHNLIIAIAVLSVTNGLVTFEIAQIVGWRMRVIAEDQVGRVFGAARLIALIGTVPGAIVGGALADQHGARYPLAVSAVGYLACALGMWLVPSIRREAR